MLRKSKSDLKPSPFSSPRSPKSSSRISQSLCGDSPPTSAQFFEVLYVGKLIASHRRAPTTFLDDAVRKLMARERQVKEHTRQPWDSGGVGLGVNRTMLLQIGRFHFRLISPDRKQVLLHKKLENVSYCCRGTEMIDHFGIICCEPKESFFAYIFRCDSGDIVKDILRVLKVSFNKKEQSNLQSESNEESGVSKVARKARRSIEVGLSGFINFGRNSVSSENLLSDVDQTKAPSLSVIESSPEKCVSSQVSACSLEENVKSPSQENEWVLVKTPSKFEHLTPSKAEDFNYEVRVSPLLACRLDLVEESNDNNEYDKVDAPDEKSPRFDIFSRGFWSKGENGEESEEEKNFTKRMSIYRNVDIPEDNLSVEDGLEAMDSIRNYRLLWRKSIRRLIIMNRISKELNKNKEQEVETDLKLGYEDLMSNSASSLPEISKNSSNDFVKNVVKEGVSKYVRGRLWHNLVKFHEQRKGFSEIAFISYFELKSQLTSHQHSILIDLGRTFPSHPYFKATLGPGQLALFNVLKALSVLDPEVGYCQGLAFSAGLLLMHIEEDEAFALLRHLLFTLDLRSQYLASMSGLQLKLYQFSRLLWDNNPVLSEHLSKLNMDPSLYATPWLLTLFASSFPLGFVARVFDLLFYDGSDAILKIAFSLLNFCERILLMSRSFESAMKVIKEEIPALPHVSLEQVIGHAMDLDVSEDLKQYKTEFEVFKECEEERQFNEKKHLEKVKALNRRVEELERQLTEKDQILSFLQA